MKHGNPTYSKIKDSDTIIVLDENTKRMSFSWFCIKIAAYTLFVFGFPYLAFSPVPSKIWNVVDSLEVQVGVSLVLLIGFFVWTRMRRR